ncbi:hypothetical protein Q428_02170 [Fervidicella metallireducens AeB]|uniref:Sporulation protein YtxC n=1 Tax=Fervidicella metallireducens AeB TaxID=1403537 RepID=A0A017RY24_9CLOT|nr:putative sporulation protein YtxC [Fervidicella metallireducens]EYE89481.1 hypothetical protein Q428_02170 [Fervidicella metallireducens AeB]
MILLSVGYSKNNRDIYVSLNELCKFFRDKNINMAIAENDVGGMHYIKCILKDTEKDIKSFEECRELYYIYCANIIYDFLIREYEVENLEKLISENYEYLDAKDLEEIKSRCISVIMGNGIFTAQDLILSINRKNNILKKIEEYLQESSEIILDGFITFRLREFNSDLQNIIEQVVDEYIAEREYSEFIKLLKYFVDIQESKFESLNIYILNGGDYRIEDDNCNDITKEMFEDFNIENIKGEINKHDLLISSLITSAPKKITIHGIENSQNQEVLDTLKNIFSDKIIYCSGCDRCKNKNIDILIPK